MSKELQRFLTEPLTKESANRFLLDEDAGLGHVNKSGPDVHVMRFGNDPEFYIGADSNFNKHHLKAMLFLIEQAEEKNKDDALLTLIDHTDKHNEQEL